MTMYLRPHLVNSPAAIVFITVPEIKNACHRPDNITLRSEPYDVLQYLLGPRNTHRSRAFVSVRCSPLDSKQDAQRPRSLCPTFSLNCQTRPFLVPSLGCQRSRSNSSKRVAIRVRVVSESGAHGQDDRVEGVEGRWVRKVRHFSCEDTAARASRIADRNTMRTSSPDQPPTWRSPTKDEPASRC
eukprot:670896-Rhodomonas_salina.4